MHSFCLPEVKSLPSFFQLDSELGMYDLQKPFIQSLTCMWGWRGVVKSNLGVGSNYNDLVIFCPEGLSADIQEVLCALRAQSESKGVLV